MKNFILIIVLLNLVNLKNISNKVTEETRDEYLVFNVTATVYNATVDQCNSDPLTTADGSYIEISDIDNLNWIAVSRDLLRDGLSYGDVVELIHSDSTICGLYEIHDCMNKRWTRRIDILMSDDIKTGRWENVKLRKLIRKRD